MKSNFDQGFNVLPLDRGGALILSAHPASLPGLTPEQAVNQYGDYGARALLSLVTAKELEQLGLNNLSALCAARGLDWLHGPIHDYQAPDHHFDRWWLTQRDSLHALIDQGQSIALHCWGGRGRTGTVAARILVERGLSPRLAIDRVRQHRPGAIETADQEKYVLALPIDGTPDLT